MRKILFILVSYVLLAGSLGASRTVGIRNDVLALLPSEITKLSSKQTTQDLKKIFSKKIATQDKEAIYLNYFSNTNDVTIGLKHNYYKYTYIETPHSINKEHKKLFTDIYSKLNPIQKKQVNDSLKGTSHESGTFITIDLPEEGLKLKFLNNEEKRLHSLLIWPVGIERP